MIRRATVFAAQHSRRLAALSKTALRDSASPPFRFWAMRCPSPAGPSAAAVAQRAAGPACSAHLAILRQRSPLHRELYHLQDLRQWQAAQARLTLRRPSTCCAAVTSAPPEQAQAAQVSCTCKLAPLH